MEHIVQFAISMDDEAIKAQVARNAEKTITDNLRKEVEGIIFEKDPWGGRRGHGKVSEWTADHFDKFLDEHREEIIRSAAELLAFKLVRTKAAKELLPKAAKED